MNSRRESRVNVIAEMQARAILEAACSAKKEGVEVFPEIMVPVVGHETELAHQRAIVLRVAEDVFREQGMRVPSTSAP